MKKALFVLTNHSKLGDMGKQTGWYLPEVAHPFFVLNDAGIAIDFASPKGGATVPDENSLNLVDADNRRFYENAELLARTQKTIALKDVQVADYAAIFFAGGHGTMWDFPDNKLLAQITADIYEQGKVVAAVCHGASALVNVRLSNNQFLITGKTVNSFTNAEEAAVELTEAVPFLLESKLIERGARFLQNRQFSAFCRRQRTACHRSERIFRARCRRGNDQLDTQQTQMKTAALIFGGILIGLVAALGWVKMNSQTVVAYLKSADNSSTSTFQSKSSRRTVLENERVQVVDYLLAPDDFHPGFHTHEFPHADVILSGGTVRVSDPNGNDSVLQLETNQVYYRAGGVMHEAVNTGSEPIRMIEIHLK